MTRKMVSMFCLVLLLVSLMLGPNAALATEIVLWEFPLSDTYREAWDTLAASFEKANPGITVRIEEIPYAEFETKFRIAAATKTVPDVFLVDNIFIPRYAEQGLLADLESFVPQEDVDDYWPTIHAIIKHKGRLVAVPRHMSMQAFRYNTRLLDEAGTQVPETWEELIIAAQKATKDLDGDGRVDQFGLNVPMNRDEGGVYQILPFLQMKGGDMLTEDNSKSAVAEAGSIAAFQFLQDLRWKYNVVPKAGDILAGPEGSFVGEKVAMEWCWSGNVGHTIKTYPNFTNWDVAPIPYPSDGQRVVGLGGWYFGMSAQSNHKMETAKFMAFLASDEFVSIFNAIERPYTKMSVAQTATDVTLKDEIIMDGFNYGRIRPRHPDYPMISDAFQEAMDEILVGNQPVRQSLENASKKIDRILAESKF